MVIKKEETYVLKLTEYREILNVLKTGDEKLVSQLMKDLKDIGSCYKRINNLQDYIFEFVSIFYSYKENSFRAKIRHDKYKDPYILKEFIKLKDFFNQVGIDINVTGSADFKRILNTFSSDTLTKKEKSVKIFDLLKKSVSKVLVSESKNVTQTCTQNKQRFKKLLFNSNINLEYALNDKFFKGVFVDTLEKIIKRDIRNLNENLIVKYDLHNPYKNGELHFILQNKTAAESALKLIDLVKRKGKTVNVGYLYVNNLVDFIGGMLISNTITSLTDEEKFSILSKKIPESCSIRVGSDFATPMRSIKTFSGYLKQFFKSLKKMSKEDQLLLSKYYVQVLGKSRETSDDVYKLLNENYFLNRMLKNTIFKESSLVYFSLETGEFSVYDDLERITTIRKSVYITNMHGLFTEFLKTGAYVFNKINESPGYKKISYDLMDLEIEYEYYEDFDDYYGSSYPELDFLIKEKTNRQINFVNEVYQELTDKTVKKYCDFAAEYFLTNFVRTDLEKFVSWVHDDLDVKSINSVKEIIENYYPKTIFFDSYQHLSCNNERYEVEKHNIRRGAEAFFNIELLGLSKVVEILDSTLEKDQLSTLSTSGYRPGYSTVAEKIAKLTSESLEFLSSYYPLSEVFDRSCEKLKLTLSTNSYGFYNLPKNTQDEIIKLSKKVILELPDKMSEYLLKNKLEGLPDKLSTLNTFYMYMSGSGNEAANNLIDCKRNGLEWSEKFSDMLGLFFKTILSSESDYHCESLNMLSSLASQFAFESDVLPKKDYNKFAFVDNEGENMLLLKTSDQNFEFDVQALCNKKQLPIDSFALAKIDSVTIKGLDKMKMEYAVNAFDTLYNLLLNNDNILVDQLNFDILKVFQKTFEYNLIGLKNRQNSELSEFIKQIIKNNEK